MSHDMFIILTMNNKYKVIIYYIQIYHPYQAYCLDIKLCMIYDYLIFSIHMYWVSLVYIYYIIYIWFLSLSACNVGDEGGFAPNIQNNEEGLLPVVIT